MIDFAIIGSNWITEKFVDGTLVNNDLRLTAVYSRTLKTAQNFANKFNLNNCFDDLQMLSQCKDIDAVYIASPNSLHYEHALLMLENGKHVICEKPLASNIQQVEALYNAATTNNVILFEACKTVYLPNFAQIKNNIQKLGKLRKANINYCKYAPRYRKYLEGGNPNTFNPHYSSGSIMDIGYYCIAFTIALFGKPKHIKADAVLLDSGVDGCGSVLLNYGDFSITIDHSKISNSDLQSEIQGEQGNMLIKHVSECEQITLKTDSVFDLTLEQHENSLSYEASFFAKQINEGKMDPQSVERSKITSAVISEIRHLTGVKFPADNQ